MTDLLDAQALELIGLRAEIERLRKAFGPLLVSALEAYSYHMAGYIDAKSRPNEPWDANHMLALMDDLGPAIDEAGAALHPETGAK